MEDGSGSGLRVQLSEMQIWTRLTLFLQDI